MKNQLIYLLLAVLVSCVSEPHDKTCAFSHEDFRETKELQAQILQLDSVYNFSKVYCVGDSFLLANNNDPAQKCKVQLYSLDGKRRLAGFAQLGHSKSEVVSNDIHYIHSGSDTFYVEDAVQGRYWVCSLDSLKNDKPCVSRNFNYSKDVISVCPLDSTYIGLDFWYAGVTLPRSSMSIGMNFCVTRILIPIKRIWKSSSTTVSILSDRGISLTMNEWTAAIRLPNFSLSSPGMESQIGSIPLCKASLEKLLYEVAQGKTCWFAKSTTKAYNA